MTKFIPPIAGLLLGLLFVASGLSVLLGGQPELPPDGTPARHFFEALGPTGYFRAIKVLEVAGGALIAIPKTRNIGLLVLGPIMVNILLFHATIDPGGLFSIKSMVVTSLLAVPSAILLIAERRAFAGLVSRQQP